MAPALVMYHWSLVAMKLDGTTLGKVGWLAAFLYAACAALRLARFNSQVGKVDKRWFIGLASPAAAGVMASSVWTFHTLDFSGEAMRYAALAITVSCGLLMVSLFRYTSFKGSGSGPGSDRVPFFSLLINPMATSDMVNWLTSEYKMEPWAAHLLIGYQGRYDIVTVAGSVGLRLPKNQLPPQR
jgi:phosphatidylserine synthase